MKITIIIPAYNEETHIETCLKSLLTQTYSANEILVVDDGSTDKTPEIVTRLKNSYANLNLISKSKSYTHQPGSKIVEAFNFGLNHLKTEFDIVCKFDADLVFPSNYLEVLSNAFQNNTQLGMYGGFCTIQIGNQWIVEQLTNPDHLRGALKAYRKECFEDIGGIAPAMGWDTIDEMKARYRGWQVNTDNNLLVKHLKPTGQHYKKELPKLFGISLFRMRYSLSLAFLTCLKMAKKKSDAKFFKDSILAFLKANSKKNTFLVTDQEGEFIRKYRWSKIKERLL